MGGEIEKVLTMVQDGKINAEKAAELIQVLRERDTGNNVSSKASTYVEKTLKIRVVSAENDNVNVNLPIKLVKVALLAGHNIASSIPQSAQYVKDIDIGLIIDAIESELVGQIVDVQSANGDTVSISIE